ncbi:sensor histidine kinase [Microbacterium sp. Leaf179]|uniref:sensor histidine kinase n=1 Tax=Microbacterium sp. Leaf179 TaxID=1736288 RepID=UPI0006F9989C|nr:PAS domain-containing sensor histidine kinase [Microbacterium sp. Leaf179]KQR84736.1 histidine kinase [Microbacterium sp. Leaf179]
MPLFEMEVSPRGRFRVFLRAQLPFTLGVAFLVGVAGLAVPSIATTGVVVAGLAVTLVATLAALVVPWERLPLAWMMAVAGLDMLAVALLRAELLALFPSVTILAIFPVLWLAYGFPWYGMAVAVFGAGFITSFRFAYVGAWPANAVEWVTVVTLPTFIVGVAVIVFVAARHLRRNSRRLADSYRGQAAALEEARDAETVASAIVDTVSAGVAFYGPTDQLEVANTRAHRFAELGGFDLDTRPFAGPHVLAADRATPIPPRAQVLPRALSGEAVVDELQWWGAAGTQAAVLVSSSRLRRPDGRILGTVVVIHDVTELAEAIEVREEFLHTVSHELRTPLTSITGFLDLIDEAIDPEQVTLRRYVDVATRRTADLTQRVGELFAAGESEKTLRPASVDLVDVVAAAVRGVASLAETHAHTIETTSTGPSHAHADRAQLVVAIRELLTNAVKFGIPSRPITVAHGVCEGRVRIAVTNTGPGIGRAEQRRAFDRFYRTPLARSREIQGFGLGLTNVRSIALAHGGTVHIDSVPGEFTTVTLDLPATAPAA